MCGRYLFPSLFDQANSSIGKVAEEGGRKLLFGFLLLLSKLIQEVLMITPEQANYGRCYYSLLKYTHMPIVYTHRYMYHK